MEITVCICTHNRPRYVRDCLDGLRRQTVGTGAFHLVLVDSGSTGSAAADLVRMVAEFPGARLIRLEQPGVSAARNAGAWAARTSYIAYLDDDAIPAPDWVERILQAIKAAPRPPGVIGGRILPKWEAPLPRWWLPGLRGVLSIIEHEGAGEYRTNELPEGMEPYAANMVVHVLSLLAVGGFQCSIGRYGDALLSDEEVQLAWKLQDAGHSACYDSRIVVWHQIQAGRLTPEWLLRRLYSQGVSTVLTRKLLGRADAVWRELPRRIAVATICAPFGLVPAGATWLMAPRWRLAYAAGFVRAALGSQATAAARRQPTNRPRAASHRAIRNSWARRALPDRTEHGKAFRETA
jgi:glycosyltransferase involved in cell wall biosynthesis